MTPSSWIPFLKRWFLFLLTLAGAFANAAAHAGGPRFVAGAGWGVNPGTVVGWSATTLLYYTDPGPLSSTVNHAQADAMVAAAASVWNVPVSSLNLQQGGVLAEDVSAANTFSDGTTVVLPADVQTANEGNVPVAVLYDADGSLTDLLLGAGASEPEGCRQNAVVGGVDDVHQSDGHIHHATLILNGRCVGSAPEQLTEMKYMLMRAFGRVLGLAWAQVNDNVFTAQTTVTPQQMSYWPVMHPIDVICGTYAYQCMSNPFTLRTDDLNGLGALYPVMEGSVPPGKLPTSDDSLWVYGDLFFPTGQGMNMVNMVTRRQTGGVTEDWEMTSGVSGYLYQQALPNPVTGAQAVNSGTTDPFFEGLALMRRIPLNGLSNVFLISQAINPLYTGDYALAPYVRPPVSPSGSSPTMASWSALPAGDMLVGSTAVASDAANNCAPGNDGAESSPAALDASGWQSGLLCSWQHTSWWSATVAAGHSWTFEVTATDETGAATTGKAQPVVGVWKAGDATGTLPTVASAPVAFNSMAFGVTQMQESASRADRNVRIAVADQFGGGRPDFTYTARLLYVASVSPASVGATGGQITVRGTGFRQGNQVTVNGVAATVVSWTSTQIVAMAPSMTLAGAKVGKAVAVMVTDPDTGGTAAIASALSYTKAPNLLQLVSAPTALATGFPAAVPFAVRVLTSDGLTPVAKAMVKFAVAAGSAQLGACVVAASCTATTDSKGIAQTTVTGGAVGSITLVATEQSGGATVQVTVEDSDAPRVVALSSTSAYAAAGASGSWTLRLDALLNGAAAVGTSIQWTVSPEFSIGSADTGTGADGGGQITISAGTITAGAGTVTGCVWSTMCATWTLYGVDPSQWQVSIVSGAGQSVAMGVPLSGATLSVTDGAGHTLQGAPVQVYQRVLAWEGDCEGTDRCAAAPVLQSSQAAVVADSNGNVSVTPLQIAGVPQVLQMAASTGTQGFVTVTLITTP